MLKDVKNTKIKNLVNKLELKTIDYLTKNYKTIIIGNMNVKSILNNKNSNIGKITKRLAYALSFYKFKEQLKYKCLLNYNKKCKNNCI